MNAFKYTAIGISVLFGVLILGWVLGWNQVLYTKIIGKAQQDVERVVFEETQSYVEGKRQEAAKYYREYMNAEDDDKAVIREVVANSFANFDESKLDGRLQTFVNQCKYGGY